jgi:hypothetical protein
MNTDEKVRQLKSEIEQVSRAAARAELERDQAKASVVKLREKLKSDFGVSTSEEAKALLVELETALSSALEDGFAAVRAAQSDAE